MTKFDHRCKQSSKEDFIFRELKKKSNLVFLSLNFYILKSAEKQTKNQYVFFCCIRKRYQLQQKY